MSKTSGWIGPLREGRFRLFFVGQLSSMIGSSMVNVALAFAVLGTNGGAADIGFVMAAYTVPTVVIALFGGAIADRFERRRIMLLADLLRMLSQGTLAVLLLTGEPDLWLMAVLAAATGVGSAFYIPATSGLIVESVSEANRPAANAMTEMATFTAVVIGPAVAGVIVSVWTPGVAIAIDAGTYVISGVCLLLLKPSGRKPSADGTIAQQVKDGWRQFTGRSWIWGVTLQFVVFHILVFAPYRVLGPVQSDEWFGGSTSWGLIQSAFGIGSVAGGVIMLRTRFKRPILVAVTAQLAWAPVVAVLGWHNAPLALLMSLSLCAGLGAIIFNVSWETSIQEHVPEKNLSSVNAYDWVLSDVSLTIGFTIAGALAAKLGTGTFLLTGAIVQIVTCGILLLIPQIRNVPRLGRPEAKTPEPQGESTPT